MEARSDPSHLYGCIIALVNDGIQCHTVGNARAAMKSYRNALDILHQLQAATSIGYDSSSSALKNQLMQRSYVACYRWATEVSSMSQPLTIALPATHFEEGAGTEAANWDQCYLSVVIIYNMSMVLCDNGNWGVAIGLLQVLADDLSCLIVSSSGDHVLACDGIFHPTLSTAITCRLAQACAKANLRENSVHYVISALTIANGHCCEGLLYASALAHLGVALLFNGMLDEAEVLFSDSSSLYTRHGLSRQTEQRDFVHGAPVA